MDQQSASNAEQEPKPGKDKESGYLMGLLLRLYATSSSGAGKRPDHTYSEDGRCVESPIDQTNLALDRIRRRRRRLLLHLLQGCAATGNAKP